VNYLSLNVLTFDILLEGDRLSRRSNTDSSSYGGRDQGAERTDTSESGDGLLLLDSYVSSLCARELQRLHMHNECSLSAFKVHMLTRHDVPDFWGPASNFGIPIAAVMDTQKDPDMYVVHRTIPSDRTSGDHLILSTRNRYFGSHTADTYTASPAV
jgi:hypothetical protein